MNTLDLPHSTRSKKPRFKSRTSYSSENRHREIEEFGGCLIPDSDHLLILEDFLEMSMRRHGRPFPMLKLQLQLFGDLVEAEDAVSSYKRKLRELKDSQCAEDDIKFVKSELSRYRKLKYALRDIGDGIAWRHLQFDRYTLSQLGMRPRKPHLNRESMSHELHELGDIINKNNEVALLNDLTHILKRGDITAKLPDGTVEFVEVKSSRSSDRRCIRQKNDLNQTICSLNAKGKLKDGDLMRAVDLKIEPRSYMTNFEKLLKEAETSCTIAKEIGDHLLVQVIDFSAASRVTDPNGSFEKLNSILSKWSENEDFVVPMHNYLERYRHIQNFAPFSIFPIEPRLRVKLMTGATVVETFLNISAVLRYLSQRGWSVVKGPTDLNEDAESEDLKTVATAVLRKQDLTIELPAPVIGRLAHEYLSIKTLGDMLDKILENRFSCADGLFLNLSDEFKQWS